MGNVSGVRTSSAGLHGGQTFIAQFQRELAGGYQPRVHGGTYLADAEEKEEEEDAVAVAVADAKAAAAALAAIEKHLSNPKNSFKMYGASWCGACKNLLASLGISIEIIDKTKKEIIWKIGNKKIEKPEWYVGCDQDENMCVKITAYPTLEINGVLQRPGGMGQDELIQKLLACNSK